MAWSRCFAFGVALCLLASSCTSPQKTQVYCNEQLHALPDLASLPWQRAAGPAADPSTSEGIGEVVAGGPGLLVAAGTRLVPEPFEWRAVVWTSSDGKTWTEAPHHASFEGSSIGALAISPTGRIVAVGTTGITEDIPPSSEPMIWWSDDGAHWNTIGEQGLGGYPIRVITVGEGFVAVGREHDAYLPVAGAVWTSEDGQIWRRVEHEGAQDLEFHGLKHTQHGLIAWGIEVGYLQEVLWHSADGARWDRVLGELGEPPYSRHIVDVVEAGSQLVAVAADSNGWGRVVAWTSDNGTAWREVDDDSFSVRSHYVGIGSAFSLGEAVVLLGWGQAPPRSESDEEPLMWASADAGERWTRQPADFLPASMLYSPQLVSFCGRLVLVGSSSTGEFADGRKNLDPELWYAEPQ